MFFTIQLPRVDSLARRFVSAAGWSVCAAALARVMMLAAWVICGRTLTKDDFGALTLVFNTVVVLSAVGGLGLGSTATRYLGELRHTDPAKAGRLMGMSYVLSLGSGVLMAGSLVAVAGPIAARMLHNAGLTPSLRAAGVLVLFSALNAQQTGALSGFHAFRQIAMLSFWTGLFGLMAVLVGVHYGGLLGAIWALGAWRIVIWLSNQVVLRRECDRYGIQVQLRQWAKERQLLWHFSVPALLTSMMISPSVWLCSLWLLRTPGGYSELAWYGAADRWHAAILFVPSAMFSAVMPMLSAMIGERNPGGFRRVMYANAAVCLILAGLPAVLFAVGAPMAMRVFGPSYVGGATVLRFLCISSVAEVVNGVVGQVIAVRSMWARFGFDVLLVASLLLGSWVLIPHYRAVGFAAAYAVAFTIVAAGLLVYARRSGYYLPPPSLEPAEDLVEV